MFELLFTRQPALIIPCLALVGLALVFTVWLVALFWQRVRKLEIEGELKQDMLNRGLTAAEIDCVLRSTTGGPAGELPPVREVSTAPECQLAEKLLAEGRPIEEVERLVRAIRGRPDGARPNLHLERSMKG